MIATDHFVYIHVSRTGGTFLNRLILDCFPGARMIQPHGHLADLPAAFAHLPAIGFARNPWDWYVSMYHDYRRKGQFVFDTLSERDSLGFAATVRRFLELGDGSAASRGLLRRLAAAAPERIDAAKPGRGNQLPGLTAAHFQCYPEGVGYFSWLFDLMFRGGDGRQVLFGRFENLREDALRLFAQTGAPITNHIAGYLALEPAHNASPRPEGCKDAYSPALRRLVATRERSLIERFGYEFPE